MPLRDHTMPAHPGRSLDHPIRRCLLVEPAFITNPVLHLTPLVLTRRDPKNLLPTIPKRHLPLTLNMVAITMRIHRLQEPNPVLEPEGLVGEGANRTNINDIADKIMIQRLLNVR